MQELGCDLIKPVVTGLEMKGQLIWGQMGPISPWTLLDRCQTNITHADLYWG